MFILIALILASADSAFAKSEVKFEKKAHIATTGFSVDGGSTRELKCNAHGGVKSEEGVKVTLRSEDLEFQLDCRGAETGSHFNLIILKGSKPISTLEYAAGSTGDCSDASDTQIWIQDLNGDKTLDIYRLNKVEFIPGCEAGEASKTISAVVYYSVGSSKELKKEKLSDQEMKKLNKQFGFKI